MTTGEPTLGQRQKRALDVAGGLVSGAVDGDSQGGADLTHAGIGEPAESFNEQRCRHALDRIEIDC
ncbi:MAG: hypothetical protein V9G04_08465 [Nocardioides sp.]|jgi:hypothetical protein